MGKRALVLFKSGLYTEIMIDVGLDYKGVEHMPWRFPVKAPSGGEVWVEETEESMRKRVRNRSYLPVYEEAEEQ